MVNCDENENDNGQKDKQDIYRPRHSDNYRKYSVSWLSDASK